MDTAITENMSTVTSAIRQVCDKDGNFEMSELDSVSGLSRAETMQAICFLNKAGHSIVTMRSQLGYWQDQTIYWSRRELARSC